MARGKRGIVPAGQAKLGLPDLLSECESIFRFRGFAIERDPECPSLLWLERRGVPYEFSLFEGQMNAVRFGVNTRPQDGDHPDVVGTMIASAAATMAAIPLARIIVDPSGDVSIHVDALLSSPEQLGRCVERWCEVIDAALAMFTSTVDEFAYSEIEDSSPEQEVAAPKKAATQAVDPLTSVFRLKVTLRDIRPAIWRRIEVPGDVTFAKLHRIIQAAMGWDDAHLHEFHVGKRRFGQPGDDFGGEPTENEARVRLGEVAAAKTKLKYWYDFGDDWWHDITVERVGPPEPGTLYPRLLDGARSAPPEDCGGVGGYEEFLAAISDKTHPEHKELLRWAGGTFDPERFDLAGRQKLIKKLR